MFSVDGRSSLIYIYIVPIGTMYVAMNGTLCTFGGGAAKIVLSGFLICFKAAECRISYVYVPSYSLHYLTSSRLLTFIPRAVVASREMKISRLGMSRL